jgi:hypothetical protein
MSVGAEISLDAWDVVRPNAAAWIPSGSRGDARVKIVGHADGYPLVLVDADAGS